MMKAFLKFGLVTVAEQVFTRGMIKGILSIHSGVFSQIGYSGKYFCGKKYNRQAIYCQ